MIRKTLNILLMLLMAATTLSAQSVKELEKKRKQELKKLEVTNRLLNETSKSKKSSVNKINIIKQSIREREQIISTINSELDAINRTIDTLQTERNALNEKLVRIKSEYATLVQKTHYRSNALSYLTFVLSAENFDQMFRRFRYLQQFAEYRKNQAREIESTAQLLAAKEDVLLQNKDKKAEVLSVKQFENQKLESDRQKENKMLNELKAKEKTLIAQQKKQQKIANELNRKIQALIDAEIKKANAKNKKSSSKQNQIVLTKEEQLIAGNFAKNKGRLPWPVEKGFVSGKFGIQQHPVLKHVTTNNKGIYIQTNRGADARAVFDGVVSQCFSVPGSNNAVIIKHGNYRTVYTNLTTLYVKEGDKVTAKQKIGKIFVDEENDNKTEMQLMLYLNTELQNPEPWLAK